MHFHRRVTPLTAHERSLNRRPLIRVPSAPPLRVLPKSGENISACKSKAIRALRPARKRHPPWNLCTQDPRHARRDSARPLQRHRSSRESARDACLSICGSDQCGPHRWRRPSRGSAPGRVTGHLRACSSRALPLQPRVEICARRRAAVPGCCRRSHYAVGSGGGRADGCRHCVFSGCSEPAPSASRKSTDSCDQYSSEAGRGLDGRRAFRAARIFV